jgi:hypothetical protein
VPGDPPLPQILKIALMVKSHAKVPEDAELLFSVKTRDLGDARTTSKADAWGCVALGGGAVIASGYSNSAEGAIRELYEKLEGGT